MAAEESLSAEAIRLGETFGWIAVPCYESDGKWVPPYRYIEDLHLDEATYSIELWERLWDGHADAPGIAVIWPADVIAVEADDEDGTYDGAEWIRARKMPRTPTFASRRGPHHLFRGDAEGLNQRPHPNVEVLSRSGGKRLMVIPPTGGKAWLPSLSPFDATFSPLPPNLQMPVVSSNGSHKVKIVDGPELPPEQAHKQTMRILGKLAKTLSTEELWVSALALNKGRLPEQELRDAVAYIAGKETPPEHSVRSTGVTLDDVHEVFRRGLYLPDATLVDVAIAAVVANLADIDPVFLMIVGAGSRGKTEAIDSLRDVPEVYSLSELTKATFFSGYLDPKERGKDHSLIPKLTKAGKRVMLLKDFGTVISTHRDERAKILAQLREVFDGSFVKATGTGQEIVWEGHLGFVAGVTEAIDEHHAVIAILGERFVYYRVPDVDRQKTARRALQGRGKDRELRQERRSVVAELVAGVDMSSVPELSEAALTRLVDLADYCTRARTAVARDGYSREVVALPEAEAPMRFAKQTAALLQALLALGYTEAGALAVIERIANDSVPPVRRACIAFVTNTGRCKTSTVATGLGLPTNTTTRALEDLALLGVLRRTKEGDSERSPNWWEVA